MPDEIEVRVTEFQANEIAHRLEVSADEGWPEFGYFKTGRKFVIRAEHLDEAIYGITSARDILQDNADSAHGDRSYTARAQSMKLLVNQIVEAAGEERIAALPEHIRRWI
jgi:hypothetical protein